MPLHALPGLGLHPPLNLTDVKVDIKIMFPYSPKKNKAKAIAEYSTLYPETNSASASGKSKGCRFVSAKIETKNLLLIGNSGTAYHTSRCALTIPVKFVVPAHLNTVTTTNPIETSYDTI
jgi:hypothetical protein